MGSDTKGPWTETEREKLRQCLQKRMLIHEIANLLGRNPEGVRRQISVYGLGVKLVKKRRSAAGKRRDSLCWDCKRAVGSGCSWSASLQPVPGWEAVLANEAEDRVIVIGCPEFIPD